MDIDNFVPLKINEKMTDYLINKKGDIYSTISGRVLKGTTAPHKSRDVKLVVDGKYKMFSVAQLVAKTFVPNDDPKAIYVNHINGNKDDDRSINLEWCRQSSFVRGGIPFLISKSNFKKKFASRKLALQYIAKEVDKSYKSAVHRFNEMKKGYYKDVYGFMVEKEESRSLSNKSDIDELKSYKDFVQVIINGQRLPYMVNKNGEIYSPAKKRNLKPYNSLGTTSGDYVKIKIKDRYRGIQVGQVVAQTFMPLKDYTNRRLEHINGDNLDNRLSNLKWVKYSLNSNKKRVFLTKDGVSKKFDTVSEFADYFHKIINLSYGRTKDLLNKYSDEEIYKKYGYKIKTERYK